MSRAAPGVRLSSHCMINPKTVEIARAAVEKAGTVCRHVQQQLGRLRSMTKDDRSPVTIADFASQAVVARELGARLGEEKFTLVAEESAEFLRQPEHGVHMQATVAALRETGVWPEAEPEDVLAAIDRGAGDPMAAAEGYWTLDPIDGTKGFLRGQQYCVALARIDRGTVTLGVMGCPNLPMSVSAPLDTPDARGMVFHAVGGGGTFDPVRLPRRAAEVRPPVRFAESLEAAHSDHSASALIMTRAAGGQYRSIRLDSQCKYAVVARAQADVYLRMPVKPGYVERIWDHAAGAIIAEECGCVVSDIDGKPLDFSHGRGLEANRGIVVAPPVLHARLIEVIGEMRPAARG